MLTCLMQGATDSFFTRFLGHRKCRKRRKCIEKQEKVVKASNL